MSRVSVTGGVRRKRYPWAPGLLGSWAPGLDVKESLRKAADRIEVA